MNNKECKNFLEEVKNSKVAEDKAKQLYKFHTKNETETEWMWYFIENFVPESYVTEEVFQHQDNLAMIIQRTKNITDPHAGWYLEDGNGDFKNLDNELLDATIDQMLTELEKMSLEELKQYEEWTEDGIQLGLEDNALFYAVDHDEAVFYKTTFGAMASGDEPEDMIAMTAVDVLAELEELAD